MTENGRFYGIVMDEKEASGLFWEDLFVICTTSILRLPADNPNRRETANVSVSVPLPGNP